MLKAAEIQRRVMAECYRRRSFCCPNYTPSGWWECDVFEVTKTGMCREYEVKTSRADFMIDRLKSRNSWGQEWEKVQTFKHQLLETRSEFGPSRFSFVTVEGVVEIDDIPLWAGWIIALPLTGRKRPYDVRLETMKEAPRLHRQKVSDKIRNHLLRTYYHRFQYWYLFQKEAA